MEQQTQLSRLVYFMAIVVCILGMVALGRWLLDTLIVSNGTFLADAEWSIRAVAIWGTLQSPLLLGAIALALSLRSGAAVWLFGMWVLLSVVPLLAPLFGSMPNAGRFGLWSRQAKSDGPDQIAGFARHSPCFMRHIAARQGERRQMEDGTWKAT